MIPKPTILPEWAMDDQVDTESGQYNVVNPPTEKKLSGWTKGEKPNRQWLNWFQRQTSLWIAYFNENLDFETDAFTPDWGTAFNGTIPQNLGYYSKQGDIVYFSIRLSWAGNSSSDPLILTNLPYLSKNVINLVQTISCNRFTPTGEPTASTIANGQLLSGTILPNSFQMRVTQTDLSSGISSDVTSKEASGRLIFSGFYFIEI